MTVYTGTLGNDSIVGGAGDDTITTSDGSDKLIGGGGADYLDGGDGDDLIFSGSESPTQYNGYYVLTPYVGDETTEADTILGGDGSDKIFAGYGDNVDGGANGSYGDYLYITFLGATSGVTVDFRQLTQTVGGATITNIENLGWVQGSNFADNINAGDRSGGYSDFSDVYGMGGNDTLIAGYYTDFISGGDGNDFIDGRTSQYLSFLYGDDGDDIIYAMTNGSPSVYGGNGNDTIYAGGPVSGGAGDDVIILQFSYYGGFVSGDSGDDDIRASTAGNAIAGGDGADTLTGGTGSDTLYSYLASATYGPDVTLEHDVLTGGAGNDALYAGYGDDVDGGAGTDSLYLSLLGGTSGITLDASAFLTSQPLTIAGGTIGGIERLIELRGTNYADSIVLPTQAFVISVDAGNGDDTIIGGNSGVSIAGGLGSDSLVGSVANDTLDGGSGVDTLKGGDGDDTYVVDNLLDDASEISAAGGIDKVNASVNWMLGANIENLTLTGSANVAGTGNELNNVITGNTGGNTLSGLAGDDTLDGGQGLDSASYAAATGGVIVDLNITTAQAVGGGEGSDRLISIENLIGSDFADTLTGNSAANVLSGGAGADTLSGGAGADTLYGAGADSMIGGTGDDTYYVYEAGDVVLEAAGGGANDTVVSTVDGYTLTAQVESLVLGGVANLSGYGNSLSNRLTGNAGNNLLNGGAGIDTLIGGDGDDIYVVDSNYDLITETIGGGEDTIRALVNTYNLGSSYANNVESLVFTGTGAFSGYGNSLANKITGGAGNDWLDGQGGADTLTGGAGNDTYVVDNDNDVVVENASQGTDLVRTSLNALSLAGVSNVENLTFVGTGAFAGTGNALANLITGGSSADTLAGGAGADTLVGGAGNDVYIVDNAGDVTTESVNQGMDEVRTALASYTLGANVENLTFTGAGAFTGSGNQLTNILTGGAANDILWAGGPTSDTLYGGLGNDTLFDAGGAPRLVGGDGNDDYRIFYGATIVENASEGEDRVEVHISAFTLSANLEVLVFAGAGNFSGIGNVLENQLISGAGNDSLNGGAGADWMSAGAGNDVYIVDDADDVVSELAGAGSGTDTIRTMLTTYSLAALSNVESLSFIGSGAFNGAGNSGANVLTGGSGSDSLDGRLGNDTLNGGAGADTMIGGGGNDAFYVDNALDVTTEAAGGGTDRVFSSVARALGANLENLSLTGTANIAGSGNALVNGIVGNAGNNTINGYLGADILSGGAGRDGFVFNTAIGGGNVDRITDYSVADDTIVLENAIFKALTATGALNAASFRNGAGAADSGDFIIYNASTGAVFYDADGNRSGAQVQIATLNPNLALTAADFLVI